MPLKFKRNYKLLVDTVNANLNGVLAVVGGVDLRSDLDKISSLQIEPPFTVEFDVTRADLATASTASITIYNLGLNTRTLIRKDYWATDEYRPVELWAGYGDGQVTGLQAIVNPNSSNIPVEPFPKIFQGNVTRAYSYRQGVNFLTKLECQDAGFAIVNGDFNRTYGPGTPYKQIIFDAINALPHITLGAVGDFPGVTPREITYCKNPTDLLEELTGGNFFVDGEKGYALNPNEYLLNATVPVISDANGLLGVPIKEKSRVHLQMLFEPGIIVGQKIQLITSTVPYYNGLYTVKGLSHRGIISPAVCGSVTTGLILDTLDPTAKLVAPS